jgi:hypothetical protein
MKYTGAVAKLLKIGLPQEAIGPDKWIDYQKEYGLGQTDIDELIGLVTDRDLYYQEIEEGYPEEAMWAGVHASRALGQLRAVKAAEPLLEVLKWEEDDYLLNDAPHIFGLIGPGAIPSLTRAMQVNNTDYSVTANTAVDALEKVAKNYPEARDEVIGIMLEQFKLFDKNGSALNGFLVNSLTNLKAEQALSLIEEAFKQDKVDNSIIRWHSVKYEFGLIGKEEHDRVEEEFRAAHRGRLTAGLQNGDRNPSGSINTSPSSKKEKGKAKTRRKIAKASQKKNRKRK